MKKKLLAMLLVACMGLSILGCSDKDDEASKDNVSTDKRTTVEILSDLKLEEYITLGEYKGLKLDKEIAVVTDKDVEKEIEYALQQYPVEVTDRTEVEKGDTANIDYVGRVDGEVFQGGTAQDVDLVIGSGSFIAGFEDKLIGAAVGETTVIDLKFPDPYKNSPDLAGKPVEFTVTINSISAPLDAPTDEWVEENIEGYSTVTAYRDVLRKMLEEANQLAADEQLVYTAWSKVVEGSTIHKYPEILIERGKELYKEEIEAYAEYAGMTVEEYLEFSDATMEEYEQFAVEYGESIAAQAMVNYAICVAEGFKVGDDGYKKEINALLEEYEITEEELESQFKRDDIEQTILLNRVCDLIVDEAEITEVESSDEAE